MNIAVLGKVTDQIINCQFGEGGEFSFSFVDLFAGIGGIHQVLKELG